MKTIQFLVLGIINGILFSCDSQNRATSEKLSLDIGEYMKLADVETVFSNQAQLELLKKVMPKETFRIAPSISNREYSDEIAQRDGGKGYLEEANAQIDVSFKVEANHYILQFHSGLRITKGSKLEMTFS